MVVCNFKWPSVNGAGRLAGVRLSMGSVGYRYHDVLCESFFASPECEPLDRRRLVTKASAKVALFEYIAGF